jgi:hypothetical protein
MTLALAEEDLKYMGMCKQWQGGLSLRKMMQFKPLNTPGKYPC